MADDLDLSIKEIDELLQHLYLKLRGKKEGLSLVEPAAILLARLKNVNPSFYTPQLARFTPIIMDTLISGASVSFGFEGLLSLSSISGDIDLVTGEYVPAGVEDGLMNIRKEINSIEAVLRGEDPGMPSVKDPDGQSETGTSGFFRESAWGTIGLPLVSTYNPGRTPFSTGRVVKARVEIRITGEWSLRKKHDPSITFDHISAEPNSVFESQIYTAITVAEKYAAAAMGMKGLFRVPREYRISLPEIASFPASAIQRLSGGSAGLAIAALLISVLSSLDLYRQRLRFDARTSFTGKVDDEGKILAVEDSHIADKVRAVFFSRFARLVLPAGNFTTAEKELADLSRKHPSRKLDLVSASDVAGIFLDPDTTEKIRTPAGKPLLQRLFMWRKHLVASLAPALLAVLVLFILPPYLDRRVTTVEYKDTVLSMKNRYKRQLSSYDVGFQLNPSLNYAREYHHDLDGLPGEEILVIAAESRQSRQHKTEFNRLHFLVFSGDGRLMHRHAYDQESAMGNEMDEWAYEKRMTMLPSNAVFLDELGNGIVAVGTNYATFTPAALIKADVINGKFEAFLHKGYFPEMTARDLDGDGTREIILAGFNNSLDASIIAVLDPAHMQGSSPSGHAYNVPKMNADIARYYIRIPEYRLYERYDKDMYPIGISILDSPDTLRITFKSRAEDVEYSFTGDMRSCGARILLSHNMKKNTPDSTSAIDDPRVVKDEEELLSGIRYWNGSEWVPEPVINGSYLSHRKMAADRSIVKVDHDMNYLYMKNALGNVIATYDVGFETPRAGSYRKTFFGDFLEDDGDEIVCALFNSRKLDRDDPDRNNLFILVFDETGHLLRRHVYDERAVIGDEIERSALNTGMQMTIPSSPFNEEFGSGYLYLGTHHKSEPPASLLKISLEDGEYQTFFHKGFIRDVVPRDVDGDGDSELVLTGYNVMLESPVIIVLDPDHIDGSSPDGACYNIPGKETDIARYYIRLPDYHRFERYLSRVWALPSRIFENGDLLKIIVRSRAEDVLYTIGDGMVFSGADVIEYTSRIEIRNNSISILDFPEKDKEVKDLLEGVRYWDGEDWVSVPTVNRSYLKHLREGE